MSLTYQTYTNQLSNLLVIGSTDANFITFLPGCIDYAEGRCYRELDLISTRVTDSSASLVAGTRTFTLPTASGTFVVVEEMNAITPAGAAAATGVRNPLTAVSKEWIDAVYPSAAQYRALPAFFAMMSNTQVVLGPSPDAAYVMEVTGTIRPAALSSTNTTTFLTTNLPDLFIAASMVFASGYVRDFGSQSDNPQQAQSWENQYKQLFGSAGVEELRKRYQSQGWTSQIPNPIATPPRA